MLYYFFSLIENLYFKLNKDDVPSKKQIWKLEIGDVVWGCAQGSAAWPGKVEALDPITNGLSPVAAWIRWYGGNNSISRVEIKNLKSLSDGLEAHHKARKKFRK